jgi:hypothetical protein
MEHRPWRVSKMKSPRRVGANAPEHGTADTEHIEHFGEWVASVHVRTIRERLEQFPVVSRTDKTLRRSVIRRLSRAG